MSSIERPLSGDVLVLDLEEERHRVTGSTPGEPGGRGARTLLKEGPLRVTLVALAPGGATAEHQADGPITIQPLKGRLRFSTAGGVHDIGPGELLCAAPGLRHAVSSDDSAVFLLTVVQAGAAE